MKTLSLLTNAGTNFPRDKFLFLLLVYLANHIYILALWDAVFWDDWVLFDTNYELLIGRFKQAGTPFGWGGYFHALLLTIGPWAYRLWTLIAYFIAGVLLVNILERRGGVWGSYSIVIATIFMIFPLNSARVAGINVPYATCYLAFFLAWYLLKERKNLAAILFLFSFNTNSLLVFYVLPIYDFIFSNQGARHVEITKRIRENWILIALPFFYFIIKQYFFKPYGFYENYNSNFDISNINYAISLQIKELYEILRLSSTFLMNASFAIVLSIIILLVLNKNKAWQYLPMKAFRASTMLTLMISGVAALMLAGFPYWIVGHPQRFYNWDSRHQLLMPFGIGIFLAGLMGLLAKRFQKAFLCMLLAFCMILNARSYYSYYLDWNKQKEIIRIISNQPIIRDGRIIVFEDHTGLPNANGRSNSYYEWNGMLKYVYKDERRYGINQRDWTSKLCFEDYINFSPYYKAGEIHAAHTQKIVLVKIFKDDEISRSWLDKTIDEVYPRLRLVIEDDRNYCDM